MRATLAFLLLTTTTLAFAGPFTVSSPNSASAPKIKLGGDYKDAPAKDSFTGKVEVGAPLSSRLDFTVEAPYKIINRDPGATDKGMGDVEVKSKGNFYRAGHLALAIEPEVTLPSGDDARGLGAGDASLTLPLILGYQTSDWELGSEAGYSHVFHQHADSAYLGLLALRRLTPALKLGAEIVTESPDAKLRQLDTLGNIGVKWKLAPRLELQGLAGRSLHTNSGDITRKYKLSLEKRF